MDSHAHQSSRQRAQQTLASSLSQSSLFHFRSATTTPMSSPALRSPSLNPPKIQTRSNFHILPPPAVPCHLASDFTTTPATPATPATPETLLHPLQKHKVRETHKALIDSHEVTGRKLINQYEVIEELGRGMHGKVKLARHMATGEHVAIKIIPRFSKKRRLGKVMVSPQDKTKKEIAILKKIRHKNVVALLEVIDDPELKKIYMVLEHVELGEIVWRKKGLPSICSFERKRIEREMQGDPLTAEEERYLQVLEHRAALNEIRRAKLRAHVGPQDYGWSFEHGHAGDSSPSNQSRIPSRDDLANLDSVVISNPGSGHASKAPSRTQSVRSFASVAFADADQPIRDEFSDAPRSLRSHYSSAAFDAAFGGGGFHPEDPAFRGRSPSMADSLLSHMSSVDLNMHAQDPFNDDFSYVPCFTIEQARSTFRDTVLGLEYLHYQGVVHRDIKPANLLWTKDYRVKISDFGVSYFGRPIRDGEVGDTVSESEARDFDDDLELAKTVGTPAFFAPELCYTDLERKQPKVSEQIDVWSLGVTLYCLIYARIPFLAEDEFQMFKKIATEDVYIPRRRLKPVGPLAAPTSATLYKTTTNTGPYRDDNERAYEDIDPDLHDLLYQMLIKNPEKRIKLRDIKRHPWVLHGIQNHAAWLDDTDPARPSSGRKIQVDEREMTDAVVPLNLLDRARSVLKKAGDKFDKLISPLTERGESGSRRRAASSAASSVGGDSFIKLPLTSWPRDVRRPSLRGEEQFSSRASSTTEHQLTSAVSVPATSHGGGVGYDPLATVLAPADPHRTAHGRPGSLAAETGEPDPPMFITTTTLGLLRRPNYPRPLSYVLPAQPSPMLEPRTIPSTPAYEFPDPTHALIRTLDIDIGEKDSARSRSVDRALFSTADKHAHAKVGVTPVVAPGNMLRPRHPRPMRSVDLGRTFGSFPHHPSQHHQSLHAFSPKASYPAEYRHAYPQSDPDIHHRQRAHTDARLTPVLGADDDDGDGDGAGDDAGDGDGDGDDYDAAAADDRRVSLPHVDGGSANSLSPLEGSILRQQIAQSLMSPTPREAEIGPADLTSPAREEAMMTAKSSRSTSMADLGTPLTSPSEVTSPVLGFTFKNNAELFQSDPSLPALLSGASSVSVDLEGELLGKPGVIRGSTLPGSALLDTSDSLTPPAFLKEPMSGLPLTSAFGHDVPPHFGVLPLDFQPKSPRVDQASTSSLVQTLGGDDDSDSDSDEGLVMAKSKKTRRPGYPRQQAPVYRRRDTNASTGSNETAKKVVVDYGEGN